MHKILDGVNQFRNEIFPKKKDLYTKLTEGQNPRAMVIGCSDSRVSLDFITQCDPGDLFVLRNAGNLVPQYGAEQGSGGESATIEYAVNGLNVQHIIVCGHTHCGAMKALLYPEMLAGLPKMKDWLAPSAIVAQKVRARCHHHDEFNLWGLTVQENVLTQLENLKTHPSVQDGLARGDLEIHGWIFDIQSGTISIYDETQRDFIPYYGPNLDQASGSLNETEEQEDLERT